MSFLPITKQEMLDRGWEQCDFVYVIGDAYVDHPSFGHAIISRILQANGFSVGIISQPDWKNPDSISILGEPKIGFIVTGGNMDSMVNHYSVSKKRRQKDAFTPGGIMGRRPDYATVVYCNLIRRTYKHTPLVIGGLEASLRRLGHYDYWSNKVKRSILLDSGADLLLYGMGVSRFVPPLFFSQVLPCLHTGHADTAKDQAHTDPPAPKFPLDIRCGSILYRLLLSLFVSAFCYSKRSLSAVRPHTIHHVPECPMGAIRVTGNQGEHVPSLLDL